MLCLLPQNRHLVVLSDCLVKNTSTTHSDIPPESARHQGKQTQTHEIDRQNIEYTTDAAPHRTA